MAKGGGRDRVEDPRVTAAVQSEQGLASWDVDLAVVDGVPVLGCEADERVVAAGVRGYLRLSHLRAEVAHGNVAADVVGCLVECDRPLHRDVGVGQLLARAQSVPRPAAARSLPFTLDTSVESSTEPPGS